jgi:hypothetical protein
MAVSGHGRVTVAGVRENPLRVDIGLSATWSDGSQNEVRHQASGRAMREVLAVALTAMSANLPVTIEADGPEDGSEITLLWLALSV